MCSELNSERRTRFKKLLASVRGKVLILFEEFEQNQKKINLLQHRLQEGLENNLLLHTEISSLEKLGEAERKQRVEQESRIEIDVLRKTRRLCLVKDGLQTTIDCHLTKLKQTEEALQKEQTKKSQMISEMEKLTDQRRQLLFSIRTIRSELSTKVANGHHFLQTVRNSMAPLVEQDNHLSEQVLMTFPQLRVVIDRYEQSEQRKQQWQSMVEAIKQQKENEKQKPEDNVALEKNEEKENLTEACRKKADTIQSLRRESASLKAEIKDLKREKIALSVQALQHLKLKMDTVAKSGQGGRVKD